MEEVKEGEISEQLISPQWQKTDEMKNDLNSNPVTSEEIMLDVQEEGTATSHEQHGLLRLLHEEMQAREKEAVEKTEALIRSDSPTLEDAKKFLCQICFDNYSGENIFMLGKCDHIFCKDCLSNYVRYKIIDGNVYPKCCYFLNNEESSTTQESNSTATTTAAPRLKFCNQVILHSDIISLLENDITTLEKYHRFKFCKENKHARECPNCHTFMLGTPDTTSKIICSYCDHTFCYYHSNAHDFEKYPTCADYEKTLEAANKETDAALAGVARRCPGCNMMVMKAGKSVKTRNYLLLYNFF
jgi:hypothetical protein